MKHRIVVLGAGYAGATTAGRLAKRLRRADVEITVVNADPDFVERIRLHQLAAGQELPVLPLRKVFAGTGVQVRIGRVESVDADRKSVEVIGENGTETLDYDTLVYALGSTVADFGVPGVAEYAHNVAGKQAALRLRERLNGLAAGETVLIVGGGLTSIETATEIAEARPDLKVVMAARGGVGDWLDQQARTHLAGALERLGITVHEHADVVRVTQDGVTTRSGAELLAGTTIWTAGFAAHPIAGASTLTVSDAGRIVVDATLRSVSHPDVYAVGDAAHVEGYGGKALRMGCATAYPMAWQGADAIAAHLTGRTAPDALIGYNSQCISLGRGDGIVQDVTDEDEPTSKVTLGRKGARKKEFICSVAGWSIKHPTLLLPSRRRRLVAA
ncbi:FAD-dependent oxidoreductase [Nocardia yamanashiensis]|uniref:NAD(P)/FAD-dependent oxidoreductase n=1 Tax=Nocardia yamanashiensis TaxID=209247 RepID=UPI001E5CC30D|nr:FAD-dependent oxidoreductase [Nocardia yamanashiensis]UGT44844.1 FAD-dependent oxidoreductase [Nocardia yamanashiensis]